MTHSADTFVEILCLYVLSFNRSPSVRFVVFYYNHARS